MSFTFQQAASATITTSTTGVVTFANAPVSGELIVLTVVANSGVVTITPPTGFSTKVLIQPTSRSVAIYYKIAGAGESTSFTTTFSTSVSAGIVARRFSSTYGWNTDQSSGAFNSNSDSTGTVSTISTTLTTTSGRLLVGIGYATNTTTTNKRLDPNSPSWSDNTLVYSNRSRMAYRTSAGGSESIGYTLTDSTLDNRITIAASEFVEYTTTVVASNERNIYQNIHQPIYKVIGRAI